MRNAGFEQRREIINNIKGLIDKNRLSEAKVLVDGYIKTAGYDTDIISVKGVIALMEEYYQDAIEIFLAGLELNNTDIDLNYNLAYVYKLTGNANQAIHYYKKAYYNTQDLNFKEEIANDITELGGDLNIKLLIGSPVHQKPEILTQFLKSLDEVNKKNINLNFLFIDDNQDKESSRILKEFSIDKDNVLIYKSDYNDKYICDNRTHLWNERLIWKVASFKDRIINYAKSNNYDYLFLIDSDLVLHNNTLEHLVSTGRDIISEIFWTKWTPDSVELPQVWMMDQYTQYNSNRGEAITNNEVLIRHKHFLSKLRQPGIYEVGGLGACTLISMNALQKGVSFKEIKNLSLWGEDRHFCVRANALGISLYVDTHYPAYHIYRESDLAGVFSYKEKNQKQLVAATTELQDNPYISRFIRTIDSKTDRFVFDLPGDWWSRFYEYEWASKFVEADDVSLDAACGICHPFKFYLSDHCKEVYACDLDERIEDKNRIIEDIQNVFGNRAAENLPSKYLDSIKYSRASLIQLPYDNKKFDKIYCISVLEHLSTEDMWKAFEEFGRVLKDDGMLVLTFDFPTINLELLDQVIRGTGLKFIVKPDFMLLDDALYTEMWNGLCCFRAILVKDDVAVDTMA